MIEAIQYVCALGYCDIDDIVSNVLGAFLGVLVYHIFRRLIVVEKQRKWNCRLSLLLIAGGLVGCIMSSASLRVYVPVSQAETAIHMVYLKAVGVLADPGVKNTDLESIVEYGTLKVYEPKYEVYIYQYDGNLYWLIGTPIDKKRKLFFIFILMNRINCLNIEKSINLIIVVSVLAVIMNLQQPCVVENTGCLSGPCLRSIISLR